MDVATVVVPKGIKAVYYKHALWVNVFADVVLKQIIEKNNRLLKKIGDINSGMYIIIVYVVVNKV